MLLAYHQRLDPLKDYSFAGSSLASTFFAALPVLVLFWLLVPRRWLPPKAAAAGAITALLVAVAVYGMPADMAFMSFIYGAGFGLLPIGWTIFGAMLMYNLTVETGQFDIVRRSVVGLSGDARIQAVLIGFAFGAFLEGAGGSGAPVAICGAILVGLGFHPFQAAVLCLIANTSPVAYGGLGTPLITLSGVTGISTETLSIMAGRQLPILSCLIPFYMVKCMCTWKQTWRVWPVLAVSGLSFALFQFTFATIHAHIPTIVVYPDDRHRRRHFFFDPDVALSEVLEAVRRVGHARRGREPGTIHQPFELADGPVGWSPYILMSIALMATGWMRQREGSHEEGSVRLDRPGANQLHDSHPHPRPPIAPRCPPAHRQGGRGGGVGPCQ